MVNGNFLHINCLTFLIISKSITYTLCLFLLLVITPVSIETVKESTRACKVFKKQIFDNKLVKYLLLLQLKLG